MRTVSPSCLLNRRTRPVNYVDALACNDGRVCSSARTRPLFFLVFSSAVLGTRVKSELHLRLLKIWKKNKQNESKRVRAASTNSMDESRGGGIVIGTVHYRGSCMQAKRWRQTLL